MIGFPFTRATFRGSLAEGTDAERIQRLADLSGTRPPEGVILLAEMEGEPVAAVGLFDRHGIFDPARSSLAMRMGLRLLRLQLRIVVAVRGL